MWSGLISQLRSSVTVKRRRVHLKSHNDCFLGSEAADVLAEHINRVRGIEGVCAGHFYMWWRSVTLKVYTKYVKAFFICLTQAVFSSFLSLFIYGPKYIQQNAVSSFCLAKM